MILQISEPYPDGRRTVWFSTVAAPETRAVYKIDYETGEVLARASIQDEGGQSQALPSTSGVYNLLDRDNHLITVRDNGLAVHGDVEQGVRTSPIRLLHKFELPPRSKCRPNDRIIGITLTYTGEVAYATVQGMVGVVPRGPNQMTDANLAVASINGERCGDESVPESDLEEVNNSIAADEDGGIYVVSTKAQYRFDYRDGDLRRVWRAAYQSGGGGGGATLSSGSGSTPDVVGTDPRDDKLIAITDGQRLMHLTLFWRDEIPADWKGLPNRDRRIACEFPVTFGDPNATPVDLGAVGDDARLQLRGGQQRAGARPGVRAHPAGPQAALGAVGESRRGTPRAAWSASTGTRETRKCRSVWGNPTVSIPNAIPTMSTESGLVYGAGVQNDFWGLEGIDFATGESKLWVPTTPFPGENSFFAATTVGPDGDIWIGGTSGISVFRGPTRPEPRHACKDLEPPRSRLAAHGRLRPRLTARRMVVRGRARDRACGLPSNASLARVGVAIARRVRRGCRHVTARGRLGRRARPCRARRYLRARLRRSPAGGRPLRFVLRRRVRLPAGRYLAFSRASDRAGNLEPAQRRVRIK